MHAGALVHNAALAVADDLGGVDGQTYLTAVAVGVDIAVRLALAPRGTLAGIAPLPSAFLAW